MFVAAGAGLRLGWSWIDPGAAHPRRGRCAEEGQAAGALALGLAATLFVSGVIEAFVTPSGLPTWARIGIGVVAVARLPRATSSCWAAAPCGPVRSATCAGPARPTSRRRR